MVMHFVWIMQRLASSRSPTKYACVAFCRVNMAHVWNCMSYFPTSMAISQTRSEKGNLHMRRSILFWKWWISHRATIPGWYLWGFFTLPALRNLFWEALPPTVGWSFLLGGSSPPDIDGPASTAIWANCQVGEDSGDLPTSPSFSASSTLFSNSLWVGGVTTSGTGGSTGAGSSWASTCTSTLVYIWRALFPSPICGVFFVLAILEMERKTQPIKS